MYRHYAEVQGAEIREFETSRDNDFSIDVDALLKRCDESTRLIFICSPNNPTGTLFPRKSLVDLLEKRGNRSAIVIDEAYVEFAGEASAIELLQRYENLIVLRTLSKALAFAGARCGSVIGPAPVIDMLDAVQAPYALATPVVECVENAMQAESHSEAEEWLAQIVSERQRLVLALREFPFVQQIWPSAANFFNFFLIQVDDAAALMAQSSDDKVLLRYFGGNLSDCVRITVGTQTENDCLLQTFAKVSGD
jgi:histidinol-phosphate aminotransferase